MAVLLLCIAVVVQSIAVQAFVAAAVATAVVAVVSFGPPLLFPAKRQQQQKVVSISLSVVTGWCVRMDWMLSLLHTPTLCTMLVCRH